MEHPAYRFKVGDRVMVKQENSSGNPRTPKYVKGKKGVVVSVHGVIDNPLDHRGLYPPLYTVMFEIQEVFGTPSDDKIWADVHEEWLEEA